MISQRIIALIVLAAWGTIFGVDNNLLIVIPAYNNQDYVIKVLDSIRQQDYPNYKIVYIDDHSTDSSLQLVQDYCAAHGWEEKVTLIKNDTRYRKLRNLYYAIHTYASDDDIVVLIDCDDTLIGTDVFSLINRIFQSEETWFMYGSDKPSSAKIAQQWYIDPQGTCAPTAPEVISNNAYRDYGWVYMHIRAFRAWLFKNIKAQDFMAFKVPGFTGKFYPACNDYAFIYPMLEMAGTHSYYNPRIVYSYNIETPLNGFKVDRTIQAASGTEIRTKKRYQPLNAPIKKNLACLDTRYDCLVISHSPERLQILLNKHLLSSDVQFFVVPNQRQEYCQDYHELAATNNCCTLVYQTQDSLERILRASVADYLIVLDDTKVDQVASYGDISDHIRHLEMAQAQAVYYGPLAYNACQPITDSVALFQYKHNPSINGYSPFGTVCKKSIFIERYLPLLECTLEQATQKWDMLRIDADSVGVAICNR